MRRLLLLLCVFALGVTALAELRVVQLAGFGAARRSATEYHPLAADYFDRLTAAGDTAYLDYRDQINQLFIALDDAGILDVMAASYLWAGVGFDGLDVPLVSTMPTPTLHNFTSSDYNILTGLKGDGSTKYVDTGRANDADPQDSQHLVVYVTTVQTAGISNAYMGAGGAVTGSSAFGRSDSLTAHIYSRSRNNSAQNFNNTASAAGLVGMSRTGSSSYIIRAAQSQESETSTSQTPYSGNIYVFARESMGAAGNFSDARIAFASVGEGVSSMETFETILADYMTSLSP